MAQYMTRQPYTIRRDATMSAAHRMMRENRIRHLPVLEGGKLVGVVTERDLHLIETLPDSDPDEVAVDEAMTVDVYAVAPGAAIDTVVETMATHRYGSAVVMEHDKVVGIFTTIDALQVLAEVLRRATS